MSLHDVVVTYGRRHQLRKVQSEVEDIWGDVVGKKSCQQRPFSNSFSSVNDSVAKTSDSSLNDSVCFPLKNTRQRQASNKQCKKRGKENKCQKAVASKRPKRNGQPTLFASSESNSSSGSGLDTSQPEPLHSHNTNVKYQPKSYQGKKGNKTTRVKKKENAKNTEQKRNRKKDDNTGSLRREDNHANQFSEFDDFSLCIEEEEVEEKPVRVNTLVNLTLLSTTVPTPQRETLGMKTSTPQGKEHRDKLLQRLTQSNLKKMATQQSTCSPLTTSFQQIMPINSSETVGKASSLAVSPACSYISTRDSLNVELDPAILDVSQESLHPPSTEPKLVTMRRHTHRTHKDISFDVSSICNFSPLIEKDRTETNFPAPLLHLSVSHSESYTESHSIPSLHSQLDSNHRNLDATLNNVHNLSQCMKKLVDLSLINPNHDHSLKTPDRSTPAGHSITIDIRPCEVSLERLQILPGEGLTVGGKVDGVSVDPDYDASRSLFSEKGVSLSCRVLRSDSHTTHMDTTEDEGVTESGCNLSNDPLLAGLDGEAGTVHSEEDDDWADTGDESSVPSENLSDILEESDSEDDLDSDSGSSYSSEEGNTEEEGDADVSLTTKTNEDDEDQNSSEDTTRYMLVNGGPSPANTLSFGDSVYATAETMSRLSTDVYQTPEAIKNKSQTTPSETNRTPLGVVQLGLHSPSHRLQKVADNLGVSCHSFKCLTPVKSRLTGEELSPRMKVLFHCDQDQEEAFNDCIPPSMMKKCVKIGEGVYGEVFRSENRKESVALKIIPIEGNFPVNDEPQKTFAEILPEIVISQTLSDLNCSGDFSTPNFVQVKSCSLVKGSYPEALLKQWDAFHSRKGSENDRPDMFPADQHFIVFEFEDSGCDLEGFKFNSLHEAKSILHQVALSLAIAELSLQFEHRDLHWGNVLLKRTQKNMLHYNLCGDDHELDPHGVQVAIIDFTLSRLTKDGCTVFSDLANDPTLFEGEGDYQFDVYRKMKEENGNSWKPHQPHSNVLWLHYLADKVLHAKSYPDSSSKEHRILSRQFRTFLREMIGYRSAMHLLSESTFFTE